MSDTKSQTDAPEITCEQCRDLLSDYVDREISTVRESQRRETPGDVQ